MIEYHIIRILSIGKMKIFKKIGKISIFNLYEMGLFVIFGVAPEYDVRYFLSCNSTVEAKIPKK